MCQVCQNSIPQTCRILLLTGCNKLSSIDNIPDSVEFLHCNFCPNLKKISRLPDSLIEFNCSDSPIQFLPDLPPRVEIFRCIRTLLTRLPKIPAGIHIVQCNFCPMLTDLGTIPFGTMLYSSGCPWLERYNPDYSGNIRKLRKIQRFFRVVLLYRNRRYLTCRFYLKKYLCTDMVEKILGYV